MAIFLIGIALFALFFAWVGAPFVPTHKKDIEELFKELSNLTQDKTFLDCGAGDGRLVIHAAKNGYKATGYELNPFVFAIGWLRCRKHEGAYLKFGFWQQANINRYGVVYMFGSKKNLKRLIAKQPKGLIVSYGFKPDEQAKTTFIKNHNPFWFFVVG